MFEGSGPRVFALPPGVDFPAALVAGLHARLSGHPPEAMARITLFVNSDRTRKGIRAAFDAGPPALLPRIRLVTDLADPVLRARLTPPVPPLRRRLELTTLVARLLQAEPDLAPRAALFDLSDSLATLMEEMHTEGVDPDRVARLDVTDQSGHWQRALRFIRIVQGFFDSDAAPDRAAHARRALMARLEAWESAPPSDPVIVAGSTGSRGTTHALMRAVACLPQGAVVLPGFDTALPQTVWDGFDDPLTGEDHPQYRLGRLLAELDLKACDVAPWHPTPAPAPERNAVISLALRPAPVTDQWMTEGPALPALPQAMAGATLVEAPAPRHEALAIALRLRQAAEDGTRAALVTPDRTLTRQVTAVLQRWGIVPDDSAGRPAQVTAPGRFLRHVAQLFTEPLSAETLLTLLKHPLCHEADRGPHLLNTRDLELHLRAKGWAYPNASALRAWGEAEKRGAWTDWLARCFCDQEDTAARPLADHVARHVALAEAIAAGAGATGAGALWDRAAGRTLLRIVEDLRAEAAHGTDMTARDYAALFGAIVGREEVPEVDPTHPDIRILGPLEVRAAPAELMILAGLNEGGWPEMPGADPWLNRALRAEAGLLLPERRIGLSAHDFQIAAAAPEIWLTRSTKSDDAETVPSRWLNRLANLLSGLPSRDGPEALEQMKARGRHWLALARAAEEPLRTPAAARPSPAPPVAARPDKLSVTEIKRLVRDPYAIYAKHVLRLRPLDPLMRPPDALLRGILLHEILENVVRDARDADRPVTAQDLNAVARAILSDPANLPFPSVQLLWRARVSRIADWFATTEAVRRATARPAHFEARGKATIPELAFTLTGTADRIDIDDRGGAHVYDYKTGQAPTEKQQRHFDKQLLLEAAMIQRGAFENLSPDHVARALFISLSPSDPKEVPAPLEDAPPETVWAEFTTLIAAYADPAKGYTARRALLSDADAGDYDHLARFGEWDVTDTAKPEPLP